MEEDEHRPCSSDEASDLVESELAFLEDRKAVEDFACHMADSFGDQCAVVVFLPWKSDRPHRGVLCPTSRDGSLDPRDLQQAARGKRLVVCVCTLKFAEEETAAVRITEQLLQSGSLCVLAVHFSSRVGKFDRKMMETMREVRDRMLNLGFDDVLESEVDQTKMRQRIRMAEHLWLTNRERIRVMLAEENALPMLPRHLDALEAAHRKLLWEDIPRELMQQLPPVRNDLVETAESVGTYRVIKALDTVSGMVWKCENRNGEKVVMKVLNKVHVVYPGELEGINREYCFLKGFVRHPCIVQAMDILHSPNRIYVVLRFAGEHNLSQYLSSCPNGRMSDVHALSCFRQIASALAACHERFISHRCVSLEHVVLDVESETIIRARLVDFRAAMVSKLGTLSCSICGHLPCAAPEVLLGGPYLPALADVWSLGITLLESAGGLGTLYRIVGITEDALNNVEDEEKRIATDISLYFKKEGCHKNLLKSNVDKDLLRSLELSLKPESQRASAFELCTVQTSKTCQDLTLHMSLDPRNCEQTSSACESAAPS